MFFSIVLHNSVFLICEFETSLSSSWTAKSAWFTAGSLRSHQINWERIRQTQILQAHKVLYITIFIYNILLNITGPPNDLTGLCGQISTLGDVVVETKAMCTVDRRCEIVFSCQPYLQQMASFIVLLAVQCDTKCLSWFRLIRKDKTITEQLVGDVSHHPVRFPLSSVRRLQMRSSFLPWEQNSHYQYEL